MSILMSRKGAWLVALGLAVCGPLLPATASATVQPARQATAPSTTATVTPDLLCCGGGSPGAHPPVPHRRPSPHPRKPTPAPQRFTPQPCAPRIVAPGTPPRPCEHGTGYGFLYRTFAGVHQDFNCLNRYLYNVGVVNLRTNYIFSSRFLGETTYGDGVIDEGEEWSATKADEQRWCYSGEIYNEYFAWNEFHRFSYTYWWNAGGGWLPLGTHTTGWIAGS